MDLKFCLLANYNLQKVWWYFMRWLHKLSLQLYTYYTYLCICLYFHDITIIVQRVRLLLLSSLYFPLSLNCFTNSTVKHVAILYVLVLFKLSLFSLCYSWQKKSAVFKDKKLFRKTFLCILSTFLWCSTCIKIPSCSFYCRFPSLKCHDEDTGVFFLNIGWVLFYFKV